MSADNAVTWKQRARLSIGQGALTNSKRPECFVEGVYPTHITRAKGCYVYDDKGRRMIDFICALGTNLFGYAHKEINDVVKMQLDQGSLYSLGSTLEVEFAEKVQAVFPFIERIKILKSGSAGCTAAVTIARAHTGRRNILSEGYHGHDPEFVSLTAPANGVVPHMHICALNQEPSMIDPGVAAVIVEPVLTDASPYRIAYLRALRELCTRNGTLLIFDETITALRFPGLSFAKYSGITPDLIVMGKALANGLPISVVGGRKEIMEGEFFISTTFAGDTLALRAAMKVLEMAPSVVPRMWDEATLFQAQFNAIEPELVTIEGYPTRGIFKAKDDLTKALFFQECAKAQILVGPSFFWCEPHREESVTVLKVMKTILTRVKNGECRLEGKMPVTPFAAKQRGQS